LKSARFINYHRVGIEIAEYGRHTVPGGTGGKNHACALKRFSAQARLHAEMQ